MREMRRRLTAIYTVTTGTILTAVLVILLFVNVNSSQKKSLESFQNSLIDVSSRLQYGSTINQSWLARMEAERRLIIHIEENQNPFLFRGSWKPPTDRASLVDAARQKALSEHIYLDKRPVSSAFVRSSVFTVKGDRRDSYYGSAMVFPTSNGFQSLIILGLHDSYAALLRKQATIFLLSDVLGIAALFLVSRYFVGRALKPAEESRKKQAEFIAAASHELRSPLAVIVSSLSAIEESPKDMGRFLGHIKSECNRMESLVKDLLALASADAESWTLSVGEVDIDTLAIEVYERFYPLFHRKGILLTVQLPEESLPRIRGDITRLEQVLSILLDNALRHTSPGKSVIVKALADTRRVLLEVEDQGCGIPPEEINHIFDRFYQGDQARTDKQHFGLGLSIAQELVRLHRGAITVKSKVGAGTVFTVSLPREKG